MAKPTIVAVGAAVQDVFLSGKVFTPKKEDGEWVEEFPLGAKMDLDAITFSTGGGATNASVTFSRLGLGARFMGQISHDPAGLAVMTDLQNESVDASLVAYTDKFSTGYSVLLLAPSGERSILTYRGASTHYDIDAFHFAEITGDWMYISSLAGDLDLLEKLIKVAKEKHMRIAINPGKGELEQADRLKQLLHKVDVLSVNKEELQQLVEGEDDFALVRHASDMAPITIMTDGPNGVVATNRKEIIKAGMYEDVPVIDRTGAGDAFGSGFTAAIAMGWDLSGAIKLASANSTSVVQFIGAKDGILREGVELHDMPMEVYEF